VLLHHLQVLHRYDCPLAFSKALAHNIHGDNEVQETV
jgi:hypothetical protein